MVLAGKRVLFHLEFQRNNNANMANRVLEYNVFASCKFDCTVISFVIYLKKESKIVEPPLVRALPDGQQVLLFDYTNIKLWEIPTDDLRRTGLLGLLPLLSLTRDGGKPDVIDEAITIIEESGEDEPKKANLLSITLTLAALAFEDENDRDALRRRFQKKRPISISQEPAIGRSIKLVEGHQQASCTNRRHQRTTQPRTSRNFPIRPASAEHRGLARRIAAAYLETTAATSDRANPKLNAPHSCENSRRNGQRQKPLVKQRQAKQKP